MAEIIPAILPKNYEDLKNKIALVRSQVPICQIDICDGILVPSRTWPYSGSDLDYHFTKILNEEEGLPFWEDIDFELDLMVKDAMENFDIYMKLGPKRMIFHEADAEFLEGIDPYIRENIEIGAAADLSQPVEHVFSLAGTVDFIQVMGIDKVGFQGEDFDEKCLEYVEKIKERYPGLPVSVDGGVDLDIGAELVDIGADRLVVGSSIFNTSDIIGTIEDFKSL